ncbi:Cytochrome P450 89A2 [Hordeum vulgare]|nr:Cytochrome P450 89A2 [Hordeum vulgare]
MQETLTMLLPLTLLLVAMVVRLYTVTSAIARTLLRRNVVVSDLVTAHRLLVRGSSGGAFSNRPPSALASLLSRGRYENLNSAPYGPFWRAMRRNLTSGVLHPMRLHRYAVARSQALRGLVADLCQQCGSSPDGLVLAAESIRSTLFGLLVAMCFGNGVHAGLVRVMVHAQNEIVQLAPHTSILMKLPGAVAKIIYRQRWSRLVTLRRQQEETYLPLIDARRVRHRHSGIGEPPAYVDTLIDLRVPDEHGHVSSVDMRRRKRRLTDGELVGLCSEFVGAGTDTVAAELQWIMANLVKRPDMQDAIRREIDAAVDADAQEVSEEAVGKLEYLNAIVMESLRLHPPVSAVSRQVKEGDDVVVHGRRVPPGTVVAFPPNRLARDGKVWADPDEFKPERFLDSDGGKSMSLLAAAGSAGEMRMMPFGAGRRMCPGMRLAILHLGYFTANLVREFEWREAEGELAVDLQPHFGFFTVMKRPLRAHLVSGSLERSLVPDA